MAWKTSAVLLAFWLYATAAAGQSASSNPRYDSERQRMALFVYNFVRFVDWPKDAFQSPSDAIRVTVLGDDPFGGWLDRLLANKQVHGRPIVVTHSDKVAATSAPHVLFVAAGAKQPVATVLAAFCRAPVLTISDTPSFANRGGVIGLVEEHDGFRFSINRTAAGEARLQVQAQLLHLAVPLFSAVSPCPVS